MKYTIITTTRFERAVRLCNKRGLPMDKLTKAIDLLRATGSLPSKYKPHKLSGFKGNRTWECHIEPNRVHKTLFPPVFIPICPFYIR